MKINVFIENIAPMNEEKAADLADIISFMLTKERFGGRYDNCDNIEDDHEMLAYQECTSERVFNLLTHPIKWFGAPCDFVHCNSCNEIMLVPKGADKCPSCGEEGKLVGYKNWPETVTKKDLEDYGFDHIEEERELTEYFSLDGIMEIVTT